MLQGAVIEKEGGCLCEGKGRRREAGPSLHGEAEARRVREGDDVLGGGGGREGG